MSLNESIVEDTALQWFGELGYAVGHGPQFAPGEPAAERDSFGQLMRVGRLRETIRRPAAREPASPDDARAIDKESLSVPESNEKKLKP
ncbi:MAG: hypothetical protein EBS05_25840 [Proteobacteria bacterium]|nr:hypothetical protein [Pseudomonadota bacterium]